MKQEISNPQFKVSNSYLQQSKSANKSFKSSDSPSNDKKHSNVVLKSQYATSELLIQKQNEFDN